MFATVVTATAAVLVCQVSAQAQDYGAFHEIETKYIFGRFTIGSSTGLETEKAFETETRADFGKRAGHYTAGQTALEFEYTPTQYMQIELGPSVSYYNIRNVPGLVSKQFLRSKDCRTAGGVYLWNDEGAARAFNERVAPLIREKFHIDPTIEFYDSPVIVDH